MHIFKATCDALDEGDEASQWFNTFLIKKGTEKDKEKEKEGVSLRLVRNYTAVSSRPSESKVDGS